eukprot:scaffold133244_cov18-Tisochrysis_lutea.AAC.1
MKPPPADSYQSDLPKFCRDCRARDDNSPGIAQSVLQVNGMQRNRTASSSSHVHILASFNLLQSSRQQALPVLHERFSH